jgi:trehalose synthase-fused probable maltokinase
MHETMPVLTVEGTDGWRSEGARARLEREALPEFLRRQRWFAGKARTLDAARILDLSAEGAMQGDRAIALVEAAFRDGGTDRYFLPMAVAWGDEADRLRADPRWPIVDVETPDGRRGLLHDAMASDEVCLALLDAIGEGREVRTERGTVRGVATGAFGALRRPEPGTRPADEDAGPILRGSAEQSNSAILFGDRLILKLFRRPEPGTNPDFEIGRFLTERARFDRVPETAGALEYARPGEEPTTLAILQGLVRNQGSGWEHALGELRGYYARVLPLPSPPEAGARPILELAASEPPAEVAGALGPALGDAAILGRRTAEMHRALASDPADPAFAPRPLTREDMATLADDARRQVEAALAALRETLDRLPDPAKPDARRALDGSGRFLDALAALADLDPGSTATRVHGDYHLGQTLRQDGDYILLDFEGEPARPLARRKEKVSPIKDVVGMLRSYDYAAHAGLFDAARGDPSALDRLAPWARAWATWAAAAFLRSYLDAASGASFVPRDRDALAALLRAYTLEKALYELLYELNNRPDWVRIPLRGVAALLD